MERFVIEQLGGANRNNVEGVGNQPDIVRGFSLKRGGGYIPLGGINQSWLGERELSKILLSTDDFLLFSDSATPVSTTWRPAANLENRDWLAYDEGALTLLSGKGAWLANRLSTLAGDVFDNETTLFLVPRAGILAPWRRTEDGYEGGSWLLRTNGEFSTLPATSTATFSETAGSGLPADTYEVMWLVEGNTANGLAVEEIGKDTYTVSSAIESLTVSLSQVYQAGSAVRFYYRPSDSTSMERFSVLISDGANAPSATLGPLDSTFFASNDALVNFAPGRTEVHNARVWGAASDEALIPFVSDSAVTRSGGFMLLSSDKVDVLKQRATILAANNGLRSANDFIEIKIPYLNIRRTRKDIPIVLPLFDYYQAANGNKRMWGYLLWETDNQNPLFKVYFTADGTTAHELISVRPTISQLILGTRLNSILTTKELLLRWTFDSVTDNGDGSITAESSFFVSGGQITFTQTLDDVRVGTDTSAYTDWGSYTTSANNILALGKISDDFSPSPVIGTREMRVEYIKLGNGATVQALGDIADYDPSTSLTSWTSSGPNAESWSTNIKENMVVRYGPASADVAASPDINPDVTLVYSSTGSLNRGTLDNFLPLSPLTSTSITAITSTPAGLLVFMDNETFLVRGDPALADFSVQRLSGTIGNDRNVIPARLGSVVMPIYKGEIYAINLGGGDVDFGGSLVNVSTPVWLPNDPFVQVVGETVRNHIVATTASGRVYRLDVTRQQWLNDPFDEVTGLRWLSGACDCITYGTRYNVDGYFDVVDASIVGTPEVEWQKFDMGAKDTMKLWRRVEAYTQGTGDGSPELEYEIRGISGTVTGLDNGNGRWVFTLPRGMVGPTADLKLKFPGATSNLVVEPPVVIEYAVRYRER